MCVQKRNMKRIISWGLLALVMAAGTTAQAATNVMVGNWLGTLDAGSAKLRMMFKITRTPEGTLAARMDSIDQGVHDIPIDRIRFQNNTLSLDIPLLQARYEGTLDKSGMQVAGTWQQGAKSMPLHLQRAKPGETGTAAETVLAADAAASKAAAEKLTGAWDGAITAGGQTLRLRLKISKVPSGLAVGKLDSTDQGASDIPLSAVTLRDKAVRFEAKGLASSYEGTLASANTITGTWTQAGQKLPLEFRRKPAAK